MNTRHSAQGKKLKTIRTNFNVQLGLPEDLWDVPSGTEPCPCHTATKQLSKFRGVPFWGDLMPIPPR